MNDANEPGLKSGSAQLPFKRVVIVSLCSLCIYEVTARYLSSILLSNLRVTDPAQWARVAYNSLPAQLLLFIVIVMASISLFLPIKPLLLWRSKTKPVPAGFPKTLGFGIIAAAIALAAAVPLALARQSGGIISTSLQVSSILAPRHPLLFLLPIGVLLVSLCAASLEIFIRGIVFRGIAVHSNLFLAIVTNCLVSYFLWPLSNPVCGVVIALASALLFYRTRSLWPSIIACTLFLLAVGPLSLLFHGAVR
jgi:membrane protease YdiL (CAAX protease family)